MLNRPTLNVVHGMDKHEWLIYLINTAFEFRNFDYATKTLNT